MNVHDIRIEALKEEYLPGTRVVLTRMDDVQAPPVGTLGTVNSVDNTGTIFVSWDTGSSLGVVMDQDACEKIETLTENQVVVAIITDSSNDACEVEVYNNISAATAWLFGRYKELRTEAEEAGILDDDSAYADYYHFAYDSSVLYNYGGTAYIQCIDKHINFQWRVRNIKDK